VRQKARLTRHYLARGDWDLFVQVFTESHCAGHQCWHLHDSHSPGANAATVAVTGDPIRDVYVAIDQAIADILADVDRQTVIVLLVSHGMSYRVGAQFLLGDVLVGLGAAAPRRRRGLAVTHRGCSPRRCDEAGHWRRRDSSSQFVPCAIACVGVTRSGPGRVRFPPTRARATAWSSITASSWAGFA
jgi:hypothetical protein